MAAHSSVPARIARQSHDLLSGGVDVRVAPQSGSSVALSGPGAVLAAFLAGRSAATLRAYGRDLADFAAFLGVATIDAAADWLLAQPQGAANAAALHYRAHLLERGLAAATVNRRLAALRSLVKVGRLLGAVAWTLDVESVDAQPYRDTRGPGRHGVRAVAAVVGSRHDAKGVRDVAIVRLLYTMGLRRAEVRGLDVADVNESAAQLGIVGKGRREKEWLTIPPRTLAALQAWLEIRGRERGALFIALDRRSRGTRLSTEAIYRLVRRAGERVGIRARPHGLRHAATTDGLDLTNGDVRTVSRFTRHRDIRTVQIYDDGRHDQAGQVAGLLDAAL